MRAGFTRRQLLRLLGGVALTACLSLIPTIALADGDAVQGDKLYTARCLPCHAVAEKINKIGPHLRDVMGRPIATVVGFSYSDGMKALGATGAVWDEKTLSEFLRYPGAAVPGTTMMEAPIMNSADRADLIAFLKTNAPSAP